MDINGFREPTSPFFFTQPPTYLVETRVKQVALPKKTTEPTQDVRFPGFAAPMEDGRLVTDYRTRCAMNFPVGSQFAARRWMQRNGEAIISQSRSRLASMVGAGLAFDSATLMPPAATVHCDAADCVVQEADAGIGGTGLVRHERVPPLFGTFAASAASWGKPAAPPGTTVYEGGRNTPRGWIKH